MKKEDVHEAACRHFCMKYRNSDNKFSAISAIYFTIYDTCDCPVFLFSFQPIFLSRSEIKNTKTKELVTCSHNFTVRLTGLISNYI